MSNRILCPHGRIPPCGTCKLWGLALAVITWALYVAAVAIVAAFFLAAEPAQCIGSYCGPCAKLTPAGRQCPYGCACFSDGYCHRLGE